MALSKVDLANQVENVLPEDNGGTGRATLPNPFRNIIINGDMSIAQRGTSVAGITSDSYNTVDRWKFGGVGTFTSTQDTDVPSSQGFATSLKLDCTATGTPSASQYFVLRQRFEGQNLQYLKFGTANAQSLTASFWIKTNKTGTYILTFNISGRFISQSYTVNSADTWEKKTLTFVGDTVGTIANTNAQGLEIVFWLSAGTDYTSGTLQTSWGSVVTSNYAVGQTVNIADNTSNYINFTGLQLEAGTTASDFEFLPVDVNLNRCLRYYQRFNQTENSYWIGNGLADVNTDCRTVLNYYPKRSNPSGTFSGTLYLTPSGRSTTTMYFDNARKNTALFYYNAFSASGAANDSYAMVLYTSATYLELNSEL